MKFEKKKNKYSRYIFSKRFEIYLYLYNNLLDGKDFSSKKQEAHFITNSF